MEIRALLWDGDEDGNSFRAKTIIADYEISRWDEDEAFGLVITSWDRGHYRSEHRANGPLAELKDLAQKLHNSTVSMLL